MGERERKRERLWEQVKKQAGEAVRRTPRRRQPWEKPSLCRYRSGELSAGPGVIPAPLQHPTQPCPPAPFTLPGQSILPPAPQTVMLFCLAPLCRCRGRREEKTACPVRSCAWLCARCRTASDQVTFRVACGHKHLKVWAAPRLMMGARAGSLQSLKTTDLQFPETSQAENCPEKSSNNKSLALQVKQQR